MPQFRIALTGDFLGADQQVAYGDIGLARLDDAPHIAYHFLTDMAPGPGDADYWRRFYSLEVRPEHLRQIDGLVVLRPYVQQAAFAEGAERLVVIGRSGAGYDKIDLAACTAHDVAVFNVPMALNHSTASSALMFMLALVKRLAEQQRVARAGRWDMQAATMGGEIRGRTLGIVGLGHSGRELVRLIAPFEMRVLAYSPHAEPAQAAALGVELTSLARLLAESDFVSLHARLTPEARGMIGAEELARMKPSAYLINIARGELIDQQALVDCLRRRAIAGAALDVYEVEPPAEDDPILQLDNVLLTPHWSCSTSDVWQATGAATVEGMLRASMGQLPDNILNRDVLARPGFQRKLARFAENRANA